MRNTTLARFVGGMVVFSVFLFGALISLIDWFAAYDYKSNYYEEMYVSYPFCVPFTLVCTAWCVGIVIYLCNTIDFTDASCWYSMKNVTLARLVGGMMFFSAALFVSSLSLTDWSAAFNHKPPHYEGLYVCYPLSIPFTVISAGWGVAVLVYLHQTVNFKDGGKHYSS